jgi:hypothetical protein
MTVFLVISLPKVPYIHRIYRVLANPSYVKCYMLAYWVMTVIVYVLPTHLASAP